MATDGWLNKVFDRRYLIVRKLGSGGIADVYLADDDDLGRKVALKLLNERHANDEQFVERFRREAQSAAGLNHPNIVSIFDRGQAEGTYYIAMEYLEGRSLKELLVRNGPTPIPIAIDYSRQILSALGFAHRNGIVHRDIKPHNIVVRKDGRLKVTDFGIARSGASQMTEAGSIVGTAQYLSPEQARGAPVDARSDLYSLGIVLYEMLTGKVPFTGDAPVEIAMKHLTAVPEPPSKLRPEVPHDLDAIVMRALSKDPDQRYGSAEEMDADLARVARGVAVSQKTEDAMTQVLAGVGAATGATMVTTPRTVTAPPVYRPPSTYYEEAPARRTFWPWLLGLLACAIAAVGGYLIYQKIENQLSKSTPVAVPDVRSLMQGLAVQKLKAQGFDVSIKPEPNGGVPAHEVVSQDPTQGSKFTRGNTVTIFVSTGPEKVTVPDVRQLTLGDAIARLTDVRLKSNVNNVYNTAPLSTVVRQTPAPGSTAIANQTVQLYVSQGPQSISIPSVAGQPFANAQSALEGADFGVVRKFAPSATVPKGDVISTYPQGTAVKGSKVTVTVSQGPGSVQVPDVRGEQQADAVSALQHAGFVPAIVDTPVTDPSQANIVLSEDPTQGSTQKQGSSVTITVGQLEQQTTTTSTTTTTGTTTSTTPATTATTTTTPTP